MKKRTCFYLSRLISSQLPAGGRYKTIKPTIAIIITKHNWIKDSQNYHNVYRFFDKDNNSYLGDAMTIYTVELTKLKDDDKKNELYNWIKFFNAKSKKEFKMASDTSEAIAKAVKKVEELSLDKDARLEYEMRMKALSDYNSIIYDAKAEGEGIKEGIKEGVEEGKMKGKIEVVINLITKANMPLTEAMKLSNLDFSYKKRVQKELDEKRIKYVE